MPVRSPVTSENYLVSDYILAITDEAAGNDAIWDYIPGIIASVGAAEYRFDVSVVDRAFARWHINCLPSFRYFAASAQPALASSGFDSYRESSPAQPAFVRRVPRGFTCGQYGGLGNDYNRLRTYGELAEAG